MVSDHIQEDEDNGSSDDQFTVFHLSKNAAGDDDQVFCTLYIKVDQEMKAIRFNIDTGTLLAESRNLWVL